MHHSAQLEYRFSLRTLDALPAPPAMIVWLSDGPWHRVGLGEKEGKYRDSSPTCLLQGLLVPALSTETGSLRVLLSLADATHSLLWATRSETSKKEKRPAAGKPSASWLLFVLCLSSPACLIIYL